MYVIKTAHNGEEIYFVSKDIEPRFNLPVVKFSNTIDNATKYDNLDVAICFLKNLRHTNFHIYPVCPSCNKDYDSKYSAISRKDNETKICPECGIKEALCEFRQSIK